MAVGEKADGLLEEMASFDEWDDQLSLLTDFIYMELLDQRRACADAVIKKLRSIGFQIYDKGEVAIREACLNATGEKL